MTKIIDLSERRDPRWGPDSFSASESFLEAVRDGGYNSHGISAPLAEKVLFLLRNDPDWGILHPDPSERFVMFNKKTGKILDAWQN